MAIAIARAFAFVLALSHPPNAPLTPQFHTSPRWDLEFSLWDFRSKNFGTLFSIANMYTVNQPDYET